MVPKVMEERGALNEDNFALMDNMIINYRQEFGGNQQKLIA